ASASRRKPMICSSEKRFFTSNLLRLGNWTPNCGATQNRGDVGKPPIYDTKYPGTYNARRDNLQGFWREQFGYTHGLLVVGRFYENVEGADGKNRVVQFQPSDREPMLVVCLWSRWTDPAGEQPDLLSFAAITDEPEPEVAAVGHDRTIINIKPEHVDAWLNPDPANLQALQAIFDDKRHPFYEHRLAA
ncbi:SOS response-associated peptidase family protein, partial [Xanthomonas phaseoli]|uniref:SOS response-associated peptidase family protein n=3 Tax=Xanthomonas phaseoli TaxID=1985254 RepID=UPI003CCEDF7F